MLSFSTNHSLLNYNTFGIDARAKLFIEISTLEQAKSLLNTREFQENKLLILGGGSNILLLSDFDGLVVKNNINFLNIVDDTNEDITVEVGSGNNWHEFVLWAVDKQYYGIENLSLIPGTVGAAPIQNIGAYGVEVKDTITMVKALDLQSGKLISFTNAQMEFGYRDSIFKHKVKGKYFITHVYFKLKKRGVLNTAYGAIAEVLSRKNIKEPNIKDVSNAVIEIRNSKLPNPKEIHNAGSFFKNPVLDPDTVVALKIKYPTLPTYQTEDGKIKIAAGWLIEKAGWKGKKINNYGVHALQALVLVNYGGARGSDIAKLSQEIIEDIEQKFGVKLEPEVNFI
jgi:UDP-N-acetylmuramate dehydrogenase